MNRKQRTLCDIIKSEWIVRESGAERETEWEGNTIKDDFEPIIFETRGDIVLYPLADLHVGAREFNASAWSAWKAEVLSHENAYIAVLGDMMNNATKTSVSNVYEEAMRPREQKAWLVEQLADVRDRILFGVGGNHENRSAKDVDDDPLYDVFAKLDIEDKYRSNCAFLFARLSSDKTQRKGRELSGFERPTYAIMGTHGSGGGMYIGSSGNKLERYGSIIDGLDILLTGHTHKPLTFPVGKLLIDPQNNRVTPRMFTVLQSASFLQYGGYPIRKMMTPTAFVFQNLQLSSNTKRVRVTQG